MRNIVRAIVASAFILSFCAAPVSAYPPGTPMTISLSPDMIKAGSGKTTLSVNNANPKAKISITVGRNTFTTYAFDGTASADLTGYGPGLYNVTVRSHAVGDLFDEYQSTKFYIPGVKAPKSGKFKAKTPIKFSYVKPGTIVTITYKVTITKKVKKKIVKKVVKKVIKKVVGPKATITVQIPAKSFKKGKNTFVVTVGNVLKQTYKFTGK